MPDNNRDPLLWLLGFLLTVWIVSTLALAYMDWRLKMVSRNNPGPERPGFTAPIG